MLRATICVLLLLPKSILGLILLASQGSLLPPGNETSTLDIEDILDDQLFGMPFSNLERLSFPMEEGDITLSADVLRLRKKHSKRQRRHQELPQRDGISLKSIVLDTETPFSDVASDGNVLSESIQTTKNKSKLYGRDTYFIRSISGASNARQQHLDSSSSSNSIDERIEHKQDEALRTASSQTPHIKWGHYSRFQGGSLLSSNSSYPGSSGTSLSSFEGSNIQRQVKQQQREDHSSSVRITTSSFIVNRSSLVPLGTGTSRHKRQTPKVTRVKLTQLAGMMSEIGQPIILRKRNRIEAKVGVLVVVENSIYRQYMQDNDHNPKAALARIRRYYGMIFSMMDQRFKTIKDPYLSVSVRISGILVAEAREDSGWLERIVDWSTARSHGRGSVLTDRALKKFTKWVSGQTGLPEYDHAMVFTAYRLTNKQGVSLGGMAYLNAICDTQSGNAVSIVADVGDFQCVKVATHELAHSLGAYHDGDRQSKTCRPDSNYVMSPLTSHENHVLRNAFFFSHCSIRDMSHHLSKESSSCVKDDPPVYYSYDLQRLPPGQLYSADMQCKLIFGKKSEYCREGNLVDIMCGQLWCRDPNKDNGCRTNTYLTALPGTKCAPNKACHLGECITDSSMNNIQRPELTNSINVISKSKQTPQTSSQMQGPKKKKVPRHLKQGANIGKRVKRKRKDQCMEDKNPTYCEGLIKLNPGGCERRAIRQYCCFTCRQQQRQRPRRIKFD